MRSSNRRAMAAATERQPSVPSEPEEGSEEAGNQEIEANDVNVSKVIFNCVQGCPTCANLDSSWKTLVVNFPGICSNENPPTVPPPVPPPAPHTITLYRVVEPKTVEYRGDGSFGDLHSFITVAGRNQIYYSTLNKLVQRFEKERLKKKMSGQDYFQTEEFKTWKSDVEKDVAEEGVKKLTKSFVKRMIGEVYSWMLDEDMREPGEKHILHDYINKLQKTQKTRNNGELSGAGPPFAQKVADYEEPTKPQHVCNVISRPRVGPGVVSEMMRRFICKKYVSLYRPKEDDGGNHDQWKYCFCVHDHTCNRDYYGELFLWSILYFLEYETLDVSHRLFMLTQNQLSAAMTAYIILRRLATNKFRGFNLNEVQRETILKKSGCFESIVKQLLGEMSNGNFKYQSLTDKKQAIANKKRQKRFHKKNAERLQYSRQASAQTDECIGDEAEVDRGQVECNGRNSPLKQDTQWNTAGRDKVAVAHLVTTNNNWGKLSPMTLALETNNREITAHPLCWEVIQCVWWQGKAEHIVKLDSQEEETQKSKFRKFVGSPSFSYILNTIAFLAFLCVYGVALISDFHLSPFTNPQTLYLALEICVVAYISAVTLEEILQVKNLGTMYLRNGFNLVTAAAILLYFIGLGLQHGTTVEYYEAARIFRALAFIAFSYLLLQYMSVFEPLGIMIPMLRQMVLQLLKFIAILAMILATFSVATHAIYCPNDTIDSQGFTRIFTQQWMFIFGASSLEDFQSPPPDYCKSNYTYTIDGVAYSVPLVPTVFSFAPAILSAQLTLTNIMMLTVIIAMFQNVYDRIKGDSTKYYKHEFLQLTQEYFYRFVVPPPLSILSQILVFITDYRINPFGFDGKTYILKYTHFAFPKECTKCFDKETSQDTGTENKQADSPSIVAVQEGCIECIAVTDAKNFRLKQEAIDGNIKKLLANMESSHTFALSTTTSLFNMQRKLDSLTRLTRRLKLELLEARNRPGSPNRDASPDSTGESDDEAGIETQISELRSEMQETFDRMCTLLDDLKESVAGRLAEQQRNSELFYVDLLERKFDELQRMLRAGHRDDVGRRRPKAEQRTTHVNIDISPTPAAAADSTAGQDAD